MHAARLSSSISAWRSAAARCWSADASFRHRAARPLSSWLEAARQDPDARAILDCVPPGASSTGRVTLDGASLPIIETIRGASASDRGSRLAISSMIRSSLNPGAAVGDAIAQ